MIFITAAVFLFGCAQQTPQLCLTDPESGKVYASYPMEEGDSFAIEFVHSVNKSPVRDVYTIQDGSIWNEQCIYYGFGAGVEEVLLEGETLSYGDNGEMIISGIHHQVDGMILVVGTISDHTLFLGEETVSLRELCGRNSKVLFTYEER